MAKPKTVYRCQECGYSAPKGLGQCPDCSAWNSMSAELIAPPPPSVGPRGLGAADSKPVRLSALNGDGDGAELRRASNLSELDRLLGGGIVAGQVVLLGGPPGIGKSTLMLQAAAGLSRGLETLYVSGEESVRQISSRARRLGLAGESLTLYCETDMSRIMAELDKTKPGMVVLDSVQTIFHPELPGGPGTVSQVRECAGQLLRWAKENDSSLFLLGHVTKEGALAGPRVLEHMVDTVLYFDTEKHELIRVLRAHKNRFGPTDEIGLFEMSEGGLKEVKDAATFFLEAVRRPLPGRAVSAALEGARAILAETQALVVSTRYPLPRRMATGLDLNRVLVLLASMERHLGLRIEEKDVFVSVAGGLKVKDPALDLAACLAVLSSARDAALPADCIFFGEVGLLGEIGRVPFLEGRLREAAKAGFKKAVAPASSLKDIRIPAGLSVQGVSTLREAAELFTAVPTGRARHGSSEASAR